MIETFVSAFVALFVVIDPPGIAPVYGALVDGTDDRHKRTMAIKGPVVALVVLLFFAFAGQPFLNALGITLDALRIAGGIMLFLIGLEMVFEKRTHRREDSAERINEAMHEPEDISVFPVAVPMLAGPGAIATIILLMAQNKGDYLGQGLVLGALALTLLITLVLFLATGPVMKAMGKTVSTVLTRVLGIIVAALAAQFILDGVRGSLLG